jgi:Cu+-exporting ATPase
MLEEGSKPRPPVDSRGDTAPEIATRTGLSWVKNPQVGQGISVAGALLAFLALAGLVLAAAAPGLDFDLWPLLARHYWLIAAASILVCLGFGKRVQGDALTDILNIRVSGRFLLALGADAGLIAGILLGIDRDDLWHLESGLAALVLADGIVAGAVLGRRLLAGPHRKPHLPPDPVIAAAHVAPGVLIPFDGFVIGGRSEVDDGLVGGSPLGSLRGAGDIVHRGARNGDGRLTIDPMVEAPATAPGFTAATLFPKMIHAKALLIFIGLVALAITLASIGATTTAAQLPLGLLVLSVATPVALGLVRPMIHATIVRRARKLGWVLNGTAVIDALSEVSALVCGRGGVVTKPEMDIVAIHPAIDVEAVELVAAAASIAQSSNGVWARALLRYAVSRKLRLAPLAEWTDEILETGFGLRALTQGGQGLIAGTREWVAEQGIRISLLEAQERESLTTGRRALWVAQVTPAPVLIGVILGGERLKPGASEMCKNAKRFGLTGALLDRRGAEGGGELARYLNLRFMEDDTLARKAMATEWSTLGLKPVIVQHRGDPVPDAPAGPRLLLGMKVTGDAAPAVVGDWAAATAREDPRLIMDLLRLCRDTKRRQKFGYLLAYVFAVPGLWLIATGQSSAVILVLAALIGLVGVIANAQLLGFVTSTATEIDEED